MPRLCAECVRDAPLTGVAGRQRDAWMIIQLSFGWLPLPRWGCEMQSERAEWSEIAFARLSWDALAVVQYRLLPLLTRVYEVYATQISRVRMRRWLEEASAIFSWLDQGAFSSSFPCACVLTVLCSACSGREEESHRFVVQLRYQGVYPYGFHHWWTGLTDGVLASRRCVRCACEFSSSLERHETDGHT